MTPRAYHSPRRQEKAEQTRARIADEALSLFLAQGFQATSVAQVARAAGVSAQTVHTHFGTKTGIVLALVQGFEQAADAEGWAQQISDAADGPSRLRAWAHWSVAMLAPARTLGPLLREAAADASMDEVKKAGDEHRRAATRRLAETMAERGELAGGLTVEEASDTLWIMTSLEVYLTALQCGWSDEDAAAWLTRTLTRTLL